MEPFSREDLYKAKHRSYYDEEYATEIMPVLEDDYQLTMPNVGIVFGVLGLLITVSSFFMYSLILGIIGIITGFISYNKGAKSLGSMTLSLSILSLVLSFFTGILW